MKKALIFVCAFAVSSLFIYMFYYYSRINKISHGIVSAATDLPHTIINPVPPNHFSDSNYIGSLGLLQAIIKNESYKPQGFAFDVFPDRNYLSANGRYSQDFVENVNEGISRKFPNHPPIGFRNLQNGDSVLFSYFFKNVMLGEDFYVADIPVRFKNKPVRSIQYISTENSKVKGTISGNEITALQIPLEEDSSQLLLSKSAIDENTYLAWQKNASTLPAAQNFIFPELDFNIIKYWKREDAKAFLPNSGNYKYLEERLKLKITPTGIAADSSDKSASNYKLDPPFFMYLFQKGQTKPYIEIYIGHEELLLPRRN